MVRVGMWSQLTREFGRGVRPWQPKGRGQIRIGASRSRRRTRPRKWSLYTVHGRHQLPEGLGLLAGSHARRQERGTTPAGLALPALHSQPTQDDQVAGIGSVATPGTGPATGTGTRTGSSDHARWRLGSAGASVVSRK